MKVGIQVKYGSTRYLTTNYHADEGFVSAVDIEHNLGATSQLPIEDLTVVETSNTLIDTFQKDSNELYTVTNKVAEELAENEPHGWKREATQSIAAMAMCKLRIEIENRFFARKES